MNDDLVFYTHPMSRGRVIRWMLEEVGEPYATEILDFETTIKSPEFASINPMAKVPAITHGEVVVTETPAICAYLADAFPEKGLAPDISARADYYRWMMFAAGPIEQSCVTLAMGFEVPDEKEGMVGYGSLSRVLNTLEGLLSGQEYAAGSKFSAADVYLASQLQWNMTMGVIDGRQVFVDYSERMHDRPASKRAASIDDELFGKMQES